MPLSQKHLLVIECLTRDILRETYREREEMIPPIDLNKIADSTGLKIMAGESSNPNLVGTYDRQKRLITVKKSDPLFRKMFTVAQALGYYYLHSDNSSETFYRHHQDFLEAHPEDNRESEVNWFAASLLTPKRIFILFGKFIGNIDALAECFGVSSTVCYYRLKHLGMI